MIRQLVREQDELVKKPVGRWRIVEMEMWDQEAVELLGPGFIEFTDDGEAISPS